MDTSLSQATAVRRYHQIATDALTRRTAAIERAWADGKIQSQERKLILRIAVERGLLDHGGRGCLERWLAHAPVSQPSEV